MDAWVRPADILRAIFVLTGLNVLAFRASGLRRAAIPAPDDSVLGISGSYALAGGMVRPAAQRSKSF
jgi:hypothetical protein